MIHTYVRLFCPACDICRALLPWNQKGKRAPHIGQKSPTYRAKEPYIQGQKAPHIGQKSPTYMVCTQTWYTHMWGSFAQDAIHVRLFCPGIRRRGNVCVLCRGAFCRGLFCKRYMGLFCKNVGLFCPGIRRRSNICVLCRGVLCRRRFCSNIWVSFAKMWGSFALESEGAATCVFCGKVYFVDFSFVAIYRSLFECVSCLWGRGCWLPHVSETTCSYVAWLMNMCHDSFVAIYRSLFEFV